MDFLFPSQIQIRFIIHPSREPVSDVGYVIEWAGTCLWILKSWDGAMSTVTTAWAVDPGKQSWVEAPWTLG